jgi:hypothetical protein
MSGKRIAGVLFFVLSAALLVTGIRTLSREPSISDPSGLGVSRAVGTFLPAIVTLIVGLWLFTKPSEPQSRRKGDRPRSKRRPVEDDD